MPDLERLLRILSILAALAVGGSSGLDVLGERLPPRLAGAFRGTVALPESEPLDGQPPRRLLPADDAEALDGPVADRRPAAAKDRPGPTARVDRERAGRRTGRDRRAAARPDRARRPVQRAAGNGGTASAEANGGAVAIGSIPGGVDVDGNASVEISTEDGIAVEIDASGDTATASAAGEDGTRAGPRRAAPERPGRGNARRDRAAPDG